jgi:FlaA1/EpsC-like NDP-sugar epimerase
MRPGEKLYEELSTLLENTVASGHEKIRIFVGNGAPECELDQWLDSLRDICEARDLGRLTLALKELVLDYSPSADLLRRIVESKGRDSRALALDRPRTNHHAEAPIC